jgi:beta-N-acetylhexosaminidase
MLTVRTIAAGLFLLLLLPPPPAVAQDRVPEGLVGIPFPPEMAARSLHPHAALVDSVLAGLDLRARVGQMIVVYRPDNATLLAEELGGVLLFSNMLADTVALRRDLDALQRATPVGYLVCLDQEGGNVSRLDAVPGWEQGTPGAAAMASWTPQAIHAEGARIGRRLLRLGVNVNLAPVLDSAVTWDGQESWMGHRERAFGSDAAAILCAAEAFAHGCRSAGVVCIGKHYPGYDVAGNTDRELQISGADRAQLARGQRRFGRARDALAGVMMSSVICTSLTRRPAVLEDRLVADAHLTPGHVVMTDDLWSLALRRWLRPDLAFDWRDYPDDAWAELGELALWAGNDLLLVTYPEKALDLRDHLVALAEREPWAREAVDVAAVRILHLKAELGLIGER